MKTSTVVVIAAAIIAAALVGLAAQGQREKPLSPEELAQAAKAPPVVAALPYRYETEYIQDPFEPDRIRRTRTEVTHVVLVHADGTVEVKPAR